jgi:hypothetical protein
LLNVAPTVLVTMVDHIFNGARMEPRGSIINQLRYGDAIERR